jgi:hypothetical protein
MPRPPNALTPVMLTCLLAGPLLLAWATPAQAQVRRCVDARGVAVYTDRPCESMQAAPREAPPDASSGATLEPGFAVRGCARRPQTLLNGVRAALEARDVNRLANWYHWTGTGSSAAKYLMDELEAIARRPLVSVELVYPAGPGVGVFSGTLAPDGGAGSDGPDGISDRGIPGSPITPPESGEAGPVTAPNNATRSWELGRAALPSPAQALEAAPAVAPAPDDPYPAAHTPPAGDAAALQAEPATPPTALLIQQMRGEADIEAVSVRFALRENAGCWWIEL